MKKDESEETEVKNIEWLKEKIKEEHEYNRAKHNKEGFEGYAHRGFAFKHVLKLINQLDEPEILSREWTDEHAEHHEYIGYAGVPVDDLKNLLVPKQELPVIPKFVADWIEEVKPDNSLRVAFEYIAQQKRDNYDDELAFWVEEGNSETFARAWLDGFTVEEEQKYYVLDTEDIPLLEIANNQTCKTTTGLSIYEDGRDNSRFELTEQEIKDYDERYWAFAVKVEELEQ